MIFLIVETGYVSFIMSFEICVGIKLPQKGESSIHHDDKR